RQAGLRAKVLDLAESNGGWVAIQHLLRSIQARQRFLDSASSIPQQRRFIFAGAKMSALNGPPFVKQPCTSNDKKLGFPYSAHAELAL
uniref:hypothetical protein n=1 Tax=Pseudomonas sp. KCJK9111 TaxID=3344555 RepID=UPI00390664EA